MLRITWVAASVDFNRGTPRNRLGRAAGVAPSQGEARSASGVY